MKRQLRDVLASGLLLAALLAANSAPAADPSLVEAAREGKLVAYASKRS